MENPNSNPETNSETKEKIKNPEKMKSSQKDTISYFEEKFINKKINDSGIGFVGEFSTNENGIYNEFKDFLNIEESARDIVNDLDLENSNMKNKILSQLKVEALKQTMPIKKTLESVEKSFEEEYNLDTTNQNRLKNILEKQDIKTLKKLAYSQNQRESFLIENGFFNNKQEARENFSVDLTKKQDEILKDFGIDIKNLTDEQKELVFNIVSIGIGEESSNIYPEDLANLFAYLDDKSQLAIIKLFLKNLSYEELVDLGLFDREKIKQDLIEEIKKFYLENFGETIDNNKANLLFDKVNLSDYIVNIENEFNSSQILENFLNKNSIKDKLSNEDRLLKGSLKEKLAKKISKEIEEFNADIKKEKYEDVDHLFAKMNVKNCNGKNCEINETPEHFHKDFIEFIKSVDSGISPEIREQIDNLQKDNFLILEDKDTNKKTYYKISDVDFGKNLEDKKIILKDITASGGIYKNNYSNSSLDGTGNLHRFFYNDLYNSLKALSNPNSKEKVKILKENDFKNLGIKEIDEEDNISSKNQLIGKISRELLKKSAIDSDDFERNPEDIVFINKGGDPKKGDMPFQVISFDENTRKVIVKGGNEKSEISYNDLYELIAEKPKSWDIIKKIKTGEEVVSKIGGDYSKLKVGKNNLFVEKGNEDKKYNFFRNDKTGVGIEITELKDNKIKYNIGKFNSKGELKKDNLFYSTDNFDKFFLDVKHYGLKPSVNISEAIKAQNEKQLEEDFEEPEAKHSKLQGFLGRMSIVEIGMAFKKIPETLKHRLQKGNELSSARLAMKMGKIMGDSVYYDLKASFASEENKIIEEMVSMRKQLGTNEMLDTIEKRVLKTSNAPRYEVEAAMTVLLEKYGNLYPKRFHKYRGSYVWYKKFGGKPGDEMYNKVQERCVKATAIASGKEQPVPFTEEVLLEDYLKYLDKNFPFRVRPRADKALGKAKKTGIAEGRETGNKKAGDMPTAAERINYTLSLIPGEEAEFIGGLEKIFPKHGSASEMHAVPFILTASGIAKDFDPAIVGMLKTLAFTTSYPELAFNATEDGIKKYQNFVIEATKLKFGDEKAKQLQKIIYTGDKEERVKKLREFWDENGVSLIDTLLGNDGLIINKAQENDDSGTLINSYLESFDSIVNHSDYNPKDEDLISEFPDNSGIYSYVGGLAWKMKGDIVNNTTSRIIFESYIEDFKKIKNLKDENGNDIPEEKKKSIFMKTYKGFEEKVYQALYYGIGQIGKGDNKDIETKIPALAKLNNVGLDIFYEDAKKREKDIYYNEFLEKTWENFKNFKESNEDEELKKEETRPDLEHIRTEISKQADTINNPNYNPNK